MTDYPNKPYVDAVTEAHNANQRNPQQAQIAEEAEELLYLLEKLVPRTTVHYAVEEVRVDLHKLIRLAHTIKTQEPT
jgi:hypothetical protein